MSARPSHCQGPCGRGLVSSHHRGPIPPGLARHSARGLCYSCYQGGAGRAADEPVIDITLPYLVLGPPEWAIDGVCAQTDPDAFFPEKGGSTREAKAICATCPVQVACLEYALDHDERFGVWGGKSERERRRIKAAREGAAAGGAA